MQLDLVLPKPRELGMLSWSSDISQPVGFLRSFDQGREIAQGRIERDENTALKLVGAEAG